jgi:hypothetical protein
MVLPSRWNEEKIVHPVNQLIWTLHPKDVAIEGKMNAPG